jgi:hypothetical protein
MRDGNFNLDKLKKDKMLAHIVGFYFALSTANQYEIAVGWIMSELNVTEMAAKKILQDVGCT